MDYFAATFPFSQGLAVGNSRWDWMSLRVYFHYIFSGHLLFLNFIVRKTFFYSYCPTFFFGIPFYLQAVHVHLANGVTLRKA
jgi:hypothetical protein